MIPTAHEETEIPASVWVALEVAVCGKIQEFETKRKSAINNGHICQLDALIKTYKEARDWLSEQQLQKGKNDEKG